MANQAKTINRYSIGFKQKVVREIEEEGISVSAIRRRYNIKGGQTVPNWIKKFGKNHLLNTVVRIEMRGEKDRIKELESEVKKLKIALADAVLARDVYKNTVDLASSHYGTDLKKSLGPSLSAKQEKKTDTR